ncbi:uncharacterized protein LOC134848006 [Symsagittifera roscoffensis]|uniref:uncharacterized protein LOC134848006 n=1 Tax=Symsagittifera roscoffensis TaxID=84072 RepID=UPI00307C499C
MSNPNPEYVDKPLEDWTSDDVAEWMDDNELFYTASLPMKDLDGRSMCELLKVMHTSESRGFAAAEWIEFLSNSFSIDKVAAMRFSFSLRKLLKEWSAALWAQNPDYEAPVLILPYPS